MCEIPIVAFGLIRAQAQLASRPGLGKIVVRSDRCEFVIFTEKPGSESKQSEMACQGEKSLIHYLYSIINKFNN